MSTLKSQLTTNFALFNCTSIGNFAPSKMQREIALIPIGTCKFLRFLNTEHHSDGGCMFSFGLTLDTFVSTREIKVNSVQMLIDEQLLKSSKTSSPEQQID